MTTIYPEIHSRWMAALATIRPRFLILTPLCLLVALATLMDTPTSISIDMVLLIIICAISGHIWVNTLNEWQDYHSGLDLITERTPFSGGSGTLSKQPELTRHTKLIIVLSSTATLISGVIIILKSEHKVLLFLFGLSACAIIVFYTKTINRLPLLCLVSPGIGFGFIMVLGTYIALSPYPFDLIIILSAAVVAILINNLLLLNQLPDRKADQTVGRRHVVIAYGSHAAMLIWQLQWLMMGAVIILGTALSILPGILLLTLVPWSLCIKIIHEYYEFNPDSVDDGEYIPSQNALAVNVLSIILTICTLIAALLFATLFDQ